MPLSLSDKALVNQCESALLNARVALSQFQAASQGTPQKISPDDYQQIWDRARLCPWTITAAERAMLDASGPINGVQLNAQFPAPGSPWNPTPQAKAKANQFASVGALRRATSYAEQHKPPTKDKSFYRRRWGSGDSGRAECAQHAANMGLSLPQYRAWLWKDEPATPTPGAHPLHQKWAKGVLDEEARRR